MVPTSARDDILYRHASYSVRVIRFTDQPDIVHELVHRRVLAFDDHGPWDYSLDSYDVDWYHLVAFEGAEAGPVGALRLARGDEVIARHGLHGFFLSDSWALSGRGGFFQEGVEFGRLWVRHANSRSVALSLVAAMGALLQRHPQYKYVFGTVSLIDFPERSRDLIVDYLYQHHRPSEEVVAARIPHPPRRPPSPLDGRRGVDFYNLTQRLKEASPEHKIPFLLHLYLKRGARLLGDVAADPTGRKLLIPLFVPSEAVRSFSRRF